MSTAGEGRSSNSDGRAWISWIGQYYWRNEVGSMIEFEFEFKISAVCLTAESACEKLVSRGVLFLLNGHFQIREKRIHIRN